MRAVGIAWFRSEDYQRIREISDDKMHPTFEQFEAKLAERLKRIKMPGVIFEKVTIDPYELLAFARANYGGGKINSEVRSAFAARKVAEKYGTDH